MILLILSYGNLGFMVFMILEMKDFYKQYLKLEPHYLQNAFAIFMLPWSFKFIYAIISDSVPIFGYRRKYYLILNGFITFFSTTVVFPEMFHDYYYLTGFLTMSMAAAASTDIIVDSIMVKESLKDPERGSEDLQTITNLAMGVSGVVGAIMGAFFTEYIHPKWGLLVYSLIGVSIFIGALVYKEDKVKYKVGMSTLRGSFTQMKDAVKSPIIYNMLIF